MDAYLIGCDGTSFELPSLLEWKFSYGSGLPCDAFEITFVYDSSMLDALNMSNRFWAEHEGETVLRVLLTISKFRSRKTGALLPSAAGGLVRCFSTMRRRRRSTTRRASIRFWKNTFILWD